MAEWANTSGGFHGREASTSSTIGHWSSPYDQLSTSRLQPTEDSPTLFAMFGQDRIDDEGAFGRQGVQPTASFTSHSPPFELHSRQSTYAPGLHPSSTQQDYQLQPSVFPFDRRGLEQHMNNMNDVSRLHRQMKELEIDLISRSRPNGQPWTTDTRGYTENQLNGIRYQLQHVLQQCQSFIDANGGNDRVASMIQSFTASPPSTDTGLSHADVQAERMPIPTQSAAASSGFSLTTTTVNQMPSSAFFEPSTPGVPLSTRANGSTSSLSLRPQPSVYANSPSAGSSASSASPASSFQASTLPSAVAAMASFKSGAPLPPGITASLAAKAEANAKRPPPRTTRKVIPIPKIAPGPLSNPTGDDRADSASSSTKMGNLLTMASPARAVPQGWPKDRPKTATQKLAEGFAGMPSLAQLQNQMKPEGFYASLRSVMGKRNIEICEPYRVLGEKVPLYNLYQAVMVQGIGWESVEFENGWDKVAKHLEYPTTPLFVAGLAELYRNVLAPYENVWSAALLKQRDKMAASQANKALGSANGAGGSGMRRPLNDYPSMGLKFSQSAPQPGPSQPKRRKSTAEEPPSASSTASKSAYPSFSSAITPFGSPSLDSARFQELDNEVGPIEKKTARPRTKARQASKRGSNSPEANTDQARAASSGGGVGSGKGKERVRSTDVSASANEQAKQLSPSPSALPTSFEPLAAFASSQSSASAHASFQLADVGGGIAPALNFALPPQFQLDPNLAKSTGGEYHYQQRAGLELQPGPPHGDFSMNHYGVGVSPATTSASTPDLVAASPAKGSGPSEDPSPPDLGSFEDFATPSFDEFGGGWESARDAFAGQFGTAEGIGSSGGEWGFPSGFGFQ